MHPPRRTVAAASPRRAAEQMPLLFQPFTQLDQRLARAYEGIGLGLAYVQRKVAAMGGTVTVQSTPGKGSRFVVRLPGGSEGGQSCGLY